MVENPMNNAVIVRTQVTLSVDVVKFEAQDVITVSSGVETPINKEEQNVEKVPSIDNNDNVAM